MRIALIGKYGEGDIVAGPERVARELYSELKENNLNIIFIEYFFSGYKGCSFFKKLFGKVYLSDKPIMRLGVFPLISKLINEQYNIIHLVNSQRFLLFIFLIKPFIKSKFMATLHGLLKYEIPSKNYWSKRYFIDIWVEKLIIKKSDLLIFPSRILLETFKLNFKTEVRRFEIIPNGIGKMFGELTTPFPPVKDSINSVFYNGYSGNIDRGLDRVYKLLKNTNNKIRFYIIGETRPDLQSCGNLEIIITELMNQKELIRFLTGKHIMIKGPAFDTFPIGLAESMALGLIPVITDKIGLIDYIEHGVNGFIYNESPNSENSLQKILDDFSVGILDLTSISCNAKKIYDELNWNIVSNKYIRAYNSLL